MNRPDTAALYKTAFSLSMITILYNIIEGIVSAYFGYTDETLALFGFGIDSFIEVISGIGIAHMIIRFRKNDFNRENNFEKTALKTQHRPETTFWGIVISLLSIATMYFLMQAKLKVGKELQSQPIISDAGCTKVCLYMSVILLASSGIFELTGISFFDSIGAAGLAFYSFKEGKECFEKAEGGDCSCSCGGDCH
ncbi:MAG: hypothetical protein CVV49_20430 [Spirochaetae bacterium HGW-Spirochaetae-5]|nr:MAG: hypothetical protein CVV49_20430 [Spirochaetae bacterium HGW-Spirochaetae-5]